MLRLTHERDVIVQIEIRAFHDFGLKTWGPNPWRPVNNTNYNATNTKLRNEPVNVGAKRHELFLHGPSA